MVTESSTSEVFADEGTTPARGSKDFPSDDLTDWDSLRDSGIRPLNESTLNDDVERRTEFLGGARMMGLVDRQKTLKPQQLRLADVCNADFQFVGVLLPRRSAKTTSLFALALGRCLARPDYLVGYTAATTGQSARNRFLKDVVPILEKVYPDEATRPFTIRRANGSERVVFDNGSIFQVLVPNGESFRGDSYDLVIIDEAGEADPATTEDLLSGILPTLDTRDDAQVIVAGTAAKFRTGNLLWETLEDGRNGKNATGILEYAAPDGIPDELLDDWDEVEALVEMAHPGVGTLTTMAKVQVNWRKLTKTQFKEEYLSIFGQSGGSVGILDYDAWQASGVSGELPEPPQNFALGFAAHPDGLWASIVAVWRSDGTAHVLLVDSRAGTSWAADRLLELSVRHRKPIVYDPSIGAVSAEIEGLNRARPRPRLDPQTWPNVSNGASLFTRELTNGNVQHYRQPMLDEAARLAVKRGTPRSNRWAFGRPSEDLGANITPLEAASLALRYYDENGEKVSLKPSFG